MGQLPDSSPAQSTADQIHFYYNFQNSSSAQFLVIPIGIMRAATLDGNVLELIALKSTTAIQDAITGQG